MFISNSWRFLCLFVFIRFDENCCTFCCQNRPWMFKNDTKYMGCNSFGGWERKMIARCEIIRPTQTDSCYRHSASSKYQREQEVVKTQSAGPPTGLIDGNGWTWIINATRPLPVASTWGRALYCTYSPRRLLSTLRRYQRRKWRHQAPTSPFLLRCSGAPAAVSCPLLPELRTLDNYTLHVK